MHICSQDNASATLGAFTGVVFGFACVLFLGADVVFSGDAFVVAGFAVGFLGALAFAVAVLADAVVVAFFGADLVAVGFLSSATSLFSISGADVFTFE